MINNLKCIIVFFSYLYFKIIFYFFLKKVVKSYVVVDIDNTLADTWHVLHTLKNVKSYELIPTLNGTIREIEKKYIGVPRIFLSNRNILTYSATLNWLTKNNLFDNKNDLLVLTSLPRQKLFYLKKLMSKSLEIYYYDDLSYNHENGKVEFYSNIISEIKNMKIIYFDYHHINKLNAND
jgi:hypothetical protein